MDNREFNHFDRMLLVGMFFGMLILAVGLVSLGIVLVAWG
jgi:hypothetical protein